jgi:hypothetical protein
VTSAHGPKRPFCDSGEIKADSNIHETATEARISLTMIYELAGHRPELPIVLNGARSHKRPE